MTQSNAGYGEKAASLLQQYEGLDFAIVHATFLDLLPPSPCLVLDVGAGSGRDAAHFSALGCEVVAVEPTQELRVGAMSIHADQNIKWLNDSLPELMQLGTPIRLFDVVMLSAVWMHLDPAERDAGMRRLHTLTHAGSRVFMSLRHGPVPAGRVMYDVGGEETKCLATACGFRVIFESRNASVQTTNLTAGVEWTKLVLERE